MSLGMPGSIPSASAPAFFPLAGFEKIAYI
jgi:hypothetical protein